MTQEEEGRTAEGQGGRQFVKYAFYKVSPEWRRLSGEERGVSKEEFAKAVRDASARLLIRSYTLTGIRGDVDFMLWIAADTLEQLHKLGASLNATHLGRCSSLPYSYLAITRQSPYVGRGRPEAQGGRSLFLQPGQAKYLFVYPFVKTRDWYKLPQEWRQKMMNEHIVIGRKFPSVKINTAYSYGLDDQEHMVSFETDSAADFVDLVMELRESQQSSYTLRDTPIFTCIATEIEKALDAIAG